MLCSQSRYAAVLSPLHNLELLSLGVSLYGPYGTGGGADEEPEVADVEMNMNLVASERIAQALPKLQKIVYVCWALSSTESLKCLPIAGRTSRQSPELAPCLTKGKKGS